MADKHYFMYVGTFTPETKSSTGELMGAPAEGIGVFDFNASTGDIQHIETIRDLLSPSWLTFHPHLPVLYAAERRFDVNKPSPGAISSFAIDQATGHLTLTARVESEGASPPFVSVHPSGRHAYTVHFVSGHVVGFPLDANGSIKPADTVIQHKLTRAAPPGGHIHHHLESPHPHMIRPAPNGSYVTVSDVGLDAILTYPTDPVDGKLSSVPSYRMEPAYGTGPRHHARHPNGRFLFACGEVNSTMCIFTLDDKVGCLGFLGALPTVPQDYVPGPEHVGPGEIVVHPNGRAIYVSNRGHDSIAVYSFDETSGSAKFLGTQESLGVTPRAFSVDPTGKYLFAANQTPGSLVRFRINPETYWPEFDGLIYETPTPVCVVFRPR